MNKFRDSFFLHLLSTIMVVLTLSACATNTAPDNALTGAEAEYAQYGRLVQANTPLEKLSEQWSHSAQEMFYGTSDNNNNGQPIALDNFRAALQYPSLFASPPTEPVPVSNGEEESCLMAFGKASDTGMLALYIKFSFENGRWLHDEVYAQYLSSDATPPDQPNCQFPSPPS